MKQGFLMKKLVRLSVFSLCSISLGLLSSQAAVAETFTGTAEINIVSPLTMYPCHADLSFGTVSFSSSSASSIALNTQSTNAWSFTSLIGGSVSPGEFFVSGTGDQDISIFVDPSVQVVSSSNASDIIKVLLSVRKGDMGAAYHDVIDYRFGAGIETQGETTLNNNGNARFLIDGNISNLTDVPAAGNYSGNYNVTVNYI